MAAESWLDPSNFIWQVVHVFCFALGGTTFIVGTACYFDSIQAYGLGAWLYIIGSCGFLGVDVLEMATFYKLDKYLTVNIGLSVVGSTLYILGSVGFLPALNGSDGSTSPLGVWGFILGSFFIGSSQLWKVFRIGTTTGPDEQLQPTHGDRVLEIRMLAEHGDDNDDDSNGYGQSVDEEQPRDDEPFLQVARRACAAFQFANLWLNADNATAVGVEANAGLGGWCFFFGTIMYAAREVPSGAYLQTVLVVWVFGSVFFTLGSCFLGYRHFKMRL